ncbi:MAG: hypothetical protein U9Q67_02700, partial [Patescibacteria group bacterium]|nr:hypothetical protein [Patescibacteria group bacterium]
CHKRLNNTNESIKYAMAAIAVNNDYKEAIEFVADMVGPKNSERWLYFAYCTKNQDVLFVRENYEANADYYNNIYSTDDPSRYKGLYERVAELSAKIENPYTKLSEMNEPMTICDIGCGSAELSKYVKNYEGFDFSEKAIEFAKTKTPNVKVINLYEYDYSRRKIYTVLEVLEHIDDLKLLDLISSGNFVIASVPSFADRGHLRRYTERIIKERFKDLIDIKFFERFNWNNGVWIRGGKPTNSHITLFGGIKK